MLRTALLSRLSYKRISNIPSIYHVNNACPRWYSNGSEANKSENGNNTQEKQPENEKENQTKPSESVNANPEKDEKDLKIAELQVRNFLLFSFSRLFLSCLYYYHHHYCPFIR